MVEPLKVSEHGLAIVTQSIFLFGATSIFGFNLARLFPETIAPFVTPGNHASTLKPFFARRPSSDCFA
jgi:hypothetical protein